MDRIMNMAIISSVLYNYTVFFPEKKIETNNFVYKM